MRSANEKGRHVRAHVTISGWVQGVLFRSSTRDQARRLGVTGWVRNLYDGTVEGLFEGDEAAVSRLEMARLQDYLLYLREQPVWNINQAAFSQVLGLEQPSDDAAEGEGEAAPDAEAEAPAEEAPVEEVSAEEAEVEEASAEETSAE